MRDIWRYLSESGRPIVLYGMGNGADKIINVLKSKGIAVSGVFASDGFVRSKTFHGMPILSYAAAKERFPDMTVLLCFGTALPNVLANVKRIASRNELLVPDVPVYGDTLFDGEFYEKHKADFIKTEKLLADGLSKKTYRNVIDFKLTGKPEFLYDCETDFTEPFNNFLKLDDNETFIDLGAYNGDTVKEFLSITDNKYNKIIAVEPDKISFKKLQINTEHTENITLVNACVGISDGVCFLNGGFGRGSNKSKKGTETPCITLDTLLKDEAPTYIKFDVEGEELNAIYGAEETIRRHKPKMLISAYHKSDDLLTLPKAVLALNPCYKVYVRHYPCLPAWDVNFYFV